MKSGDKVICCHTHGPLNCASGYTVRESCVAIDRLTLEEVNGIFRMRDFILDSPESRIDIRAGQWWVTRGLFLILVSYVTDEHLLVSAPCSENGCRIDPYYLDGRYSLSEDTEFDLICRAPVGMDCEVGRFLFACEMDVDAVQAANGRPVNV